MFIKFRKIVIYKVYFNRYFNKLYTLGFCNADKNINKFNMEFELPNMGISNNMQSYIKYIHYVLPVNTFF